MLNSQCTSSPSPPLQNGASGTQTCEWGKDSTIGSDQKGLIIQNNEEQGVDDETLKKKTESKLKYRKLKQKLISICGTMQQKCLIKENKEVSSPNKSRILSLAIQFQKIALHQTKDYYALESKLKEIIKILDYKREHDLLILKQSRFIHAFSSLLKRFPTFHKNQYLQSLKTIDLGLKIVKIFCTVSSNRDFMISTNQTTILNACLGCFLGKQERKMSIQCLDILHLLLSSRIKAELQQIVILTLQIVFQGQLGKKIRHAMQNCLSDEGIFDQEFVLKCLKYLYLIYRKIFEKSLDQPLYNQPTLSYNFEIHFESILPFLQGLLSSMMFEKDGSLREEQLSICIINISLYILKLVNIIFHITIELGQKMIQIHGKNPFIKAVQHLFEYSKNNVDNGTGLYELNSICSEIIMFIGKIAFDSYENKLKLRQTGIIDQLYNHPITYIMDNKLKAILMPSLCSVMDGEKINMKKFLNQCSADSIVQFIEEQTKFESQKQEMIESQKEEKKETLTRKESVSSLNSYTTQCTQNSYKGMQTKTKKENVLLKLLPRERWKQLKFDLQKQDT